MRHYMPGSSINAISQDGVSSAAERNRKGYFDQRAYCASGDLQDGTGVCEC
jgi:hypothetical protein